jgi:inner membrane protein
MHREGHIGVALAAHTPLGFMAYAAGFQDVALAGAAVTLGLAMAPDVDMKIPGIPHRGPTHTVWFAAAVGAVATLVGALMGTEYGILGVLALAPFAGLMATVAVLSHLIADALTPMGIRPFEPRGDREICFDVARAANPIANYGLLVLGGVVAFVGWAFAAAISG